MTSRSTIWRRRQRIKDILKDKISTADVSTNSIYDISNHSFCTNDNLSSQAQPDEPVGNDLNNQSSSSSSSFEDFMASIGINKEQYIPDDIQIDSNTEDEEKHEENEYFDLSTDPSIREVACVLSLLKIRHNLSNRCLDHFCKLMTLLKAQNIPKSSAHIKRILLPTATIDNVPPSYFCSKCNKLSTNETNCSNVNCPENNGFTAKPPVFVRMPLKSQIKNVLSRFPSHYFQQQSKFLSTDSSNITEGLLYKRIVQQENDNFISLVMNIDGIEISKSSKTSLWVITFIINELKRTERFQMENVLVGGIGAGLSKPSREEMAAYLQPIINELLSLENECRFRMSDGNDLFIKVFLIAGSLDKPAQALVQNLTECNGAYGCGKCLLKGITVPIKPDSTKKIRVFSIRKDDIQPKLRNNFTYDVKMAIPERFRPKEKKARRDYMCGYLGECALRDLLYFDVGRCFAFDTLHNLYRGSFSRLLELWFDAVHRHERWSLKSKIQLIDFSLSTYKYPSTTYRLPRTILKYYQFKANELRCILLFGFSSFCIYLPKKYGRHFLLLVMIAHLCESKIITPKQLSQIKILTNEFIYQFPLLYSDRQNVISIHSIMHISESVRDFGGVYNYSTFNFESYLG